MQNYGDPFIYFMQKEGVVLDRRKEFMERLTDSSKLNQIAFTGIPIVEIAGENRVLIENHCGVSEYGTTKITVNVKYGSINVCGHQLELRQMTKEQLVISGKIDCISLTRRNKK